jgi:hypothetical protein
MRACANLVQGGFSDWYLPELKDLTFLLSYDAANIPNNSSLNYIWTQTFPTSTSNSFAVFRFNEGWISYYDGGNYPQKYRCVR